MGRGGMGAAGSAEVEECEDSSDEVKVLSSDEEGGDEEEEERKVTTKEKIQNLFRRKEKPQAGNEEEEEEEEEEVAEEIAADEEAAPGEEVVVTDVPKKQSRFYWWLRRRDAHEKVRSSAFGFCIGADGEYETTILPEEEPEPLPEDLGTPEFVGDFITYSMASEVHGAPNARWVTMEAGGLLHKGPPKYAVIGGKDPDGSVYYVSRVHFRKGMHPCKAGMSVGRGEPGFPQHGGCQTSHNRNEVKLFSRPFEILVCKKLYELGWKQKEKNINPVAAIIAGADAQGRYVNGEFTATAPAKPLWIARVFAKGGVHIGKAGPYIQKGNIAIIPIGDNEYEYTDFEVLVAAKLDEPEGKQEVEADGSWDPNYGPHL